MSEAQEIHQQEPAQDDPVAESIGVTLLDGEEILHNRRPSWAKWTMQILLILFVSLPTLGVGLVLLFFPWYSRRKSRYIVTSQRIMFKKGGILRTQTDEYRISDIRQLQTGQTLLERLAGYGNIEFSAGGTNLIKFTGVPDYKSIANTIRTRQKELE